ncbi:MAG TPA: hypothetical protein VFG72_03440 [Marmoricola sp.]|nr:hypothetical protein [Marmoricola sp.]
MTLSTPDSEADSIERYLADHLGREVRVGVMLGTPRANQKPVLQVFSLDGDVVAFVKVGHNELTSALVRGEAEALRRLAQHRPGSFRPPRLLHHGQWRSMEVLVQSVLSGDLGLHATAGQRTTAMSELARLFGTRSERLVDSDFFGTIGARVDEVADPDLERRLRRCRQQIADLWGDSVLELGAWHGDWGHWNMALTSEAVQLWDWERFDADVPVGFDGVHFQAQVVRPTASDRSEQESQFLERVPGELLSCGVPPGRHRLVLALYLLEVGVRYATDLNHPTGEHVRRRCEWAVELLEREIETDSSTEHVRGTHTP